MAANNIYIQVDFNSQAAQQNVNALNSAIQSTGTTAQKSSTQATAAVNSVSVAVKQTTQAFGELATALAGLGIARWVSSMIEVSAEIGRAQQMMTLFTGSADDARKVFEEIRAIAAQSPFHFKDLESAGRQLLAFGMAAKDVPGTLQAISDQVAAMGGDFEQVSSIVRIFGRVMEKDAVGAMDLMRQLPQRGVDVMKALQAAMSAQLHENVTKEDVQRYIKEGVLDPMATLQVMVQAMAAKTKGAGAAINDAANAFKNLGDNILYATAQFFGPSGFGPALTALAHHIETILAPIAAFIGWLKQLPEPVKEFITNTLAGAAALGVLAGAFKLISTVGGPAVKVIWDFGKALLFTFVENPEILVGILAIAGAIWGLTKLFPQQTKAVEDWAAGMAKSIGETVKKYAGISGLFGPHKPQPGGTEQAKKDILVESEENLKAVQEQVNQWGDAAAKTLLQALSSPVEAVTLKYQELFTKLNKLLHDKVISEEHADQLRGQLASAERLEMDAKVFEKEKQHIAEVAKLDTEYVKGSYDARIAYIEAMDAQDLRGKVKAVDEITQLRIDSAQEVAAVETDELQRVYDTQKKYLEELVAYQVISQQQANDALAARAQEWLDKRQVIEQKAINETEKYRLEGWKRANDLIIEDQKRVFEGFKSIFDQIFDAFTDKTKNLGQAIGDMFKKLALGEAKELFSSQLAAGATEAAGYGRPEEQLVKGGGLIGALFRRGMPPRPPGAPPELYKPERTESKFLPDEMQAAVTPAVVPVIESATKPLEASAQVFTSGTGQFQQAVGDFSAAVQAFKGGGQQTATALQVQGAADAGAADTSDVFSQASAATGVSPTLLRSVAKVESNFNPNAVSSKGAMGVMQLMPATARALGVTNPFDPAQNVMGGAKELARLKDKYGGDETKALAAYNWGEGKVDRMIAQGGTLPASVQGYVDAVQGQEAGGAGGGGGRSWWQKLAGAFSFFPSSFVHAGEGQETAAAQRRFALPPGFSYVGGGGSTAYTPLPVPGTEQPMLSEADVPTLRPEQLWGTDQSGNLLTPGPTVAEQAMTAKQNELAKAAGMVFQAGGVGTGGGTEKTLLGGLMNLKALGQSFGIGGTASGGTSIGSVLNSAGVANLALMGGMGLMSAGIQHRSSAMQVAGGALTGVKLGQMLGMGWAQGPIMGAGIGLFSAGVQKGGAAGLGMDVAGGALAGGMIGLRFGGPMGAAIGAGVGAAVGAVTGAIRLVVKTESERIRQQIKQVYGIDISNVQIIAQIKQIVDQNYGGSVSVGIRSQEVQNLVRLYALSTGQATTNMPRPMYAATIAQSAQGMQLQPIYQGGVQVQNPYTGTTTYQYESAVAAAQGLKAGTSLGVPGASGLISQQWQQLTVQTIQGNPGAIAMASAAAARAGDSRLTTSAAMQEPLTALG